MVKYTFKVVIAGGMVGKTSIACRFTDSRYVFNPLEIATIGVNFMLSTVNVLGEIVMLQIWDTCGMERFQRLTRTQFRKSHAIIFMYDISRQSTLDFVASFLEDIEKYTDSNCIRILVGNKSDLDVREVPTRAGEEFAKKFDMNFIETSAKDGENVERLFKDLAEDLVKEARCGRIVCNIIDEI